MHGTNVLFVPWPLHIPRLRMLKYFCIFSGLVPQCSGKVSQGSVETSWLAEKPMPLDWHLEFGAWTATSAMAGPRGKADAVDIPVWGWGISPQELPVPHPSPDARQASVDAGIKWDHTPWLPSPGPKNATVRPELAPRPGRRQSAVLCSLEHHHPTCCFRKPSVMKLDSIKKNCIKI